LQAVSKFDQAISIDPNRHDALWCLGNAYTSQGFLSPEPATAGAFFDKAAECFKGAQLQDPANDSYRRALEMSARAPELYRELQRQLAAATGEGLGSPREVGSPGSSRRGGGGGTLKAPMISDYWYDVAGWAVLVGLCVGVVALSRAGAAAVPGSK
jgi:tetratricopeptide (TPR) repeat protein